MSHNDDTTYEAITIERLNLELTEARALIKEAHNQNETLSRHLSKIAAEKRAILEEVREHITIMGTERSIFAKQMITHGMTPFTRTVTGTVTASVTVPWSVEVVLDANVSDVQIAAQIQDDVLQAFDVDFESTLCYSDIGGDNDHESVVEFDWSFSRNDVHSRPSVAD